MTLAEAVLGKTYAVAGINTNDEELNNFLFTLGCYAGAQITVISQISNSLVLAIRDGRYNVDKKLAAAIVVE